VIGIVKLLLKLCEKWESRSDFQGRCLPGFSTAFALPNHLREGEPMNKEGLVHEVPDDERKAFVRAYVHRAMHRLQKRRRSKNLSRPSLLGQRCDRSLDFPPESRIGLER
jgi:hypothetical protein